MQFYRAAFSVVIFGSTALFFSPARVAAQDPLQAVKDLYASAAYEDALSAVGTLDPAARTVDSEQYRIFCLVALGRLDEADRAAEVLLTARPEYRPDPAQASPRIQSLFADVRRRVGPTLVKRTYQQAKAAMERKDRDAAISGFEAMLRIADDPDVRTNASVAELKELGTGFLELSRAMAPKPAPVEAAPAAAAASSPGVNVITPPIVIQQKLPAWVPDYTSRATEFRGAIRVQISTEGKVVAADIVKSIHPAYDQLLLRAARNWLYTPATKNGAPIAMEKTVEVSVAPATRPGNAAAPPTKVGRSGGI
jgi:TonB family protein